MANRRVVMGVLLAGAGVLVAPGTGFGAPAGNAAQLAGEQRVPMSIDASCEVESDYDFHLTDRSVVFTRTEGSPRTVLVRAGRLFVDDRWVAVEAADSARLRDYEREARAAMPLARQIGQEAADIAFTALGEVAAGFSNDPAATRATLAAARTKLDAHMARSITPTRFSGDTLGDGIGEAVSEVLPTLVGDVVGGAVRAALSGDTARLARMEGMDARIEAHVGPRAKALEAKAQALCRRMESLARLDDALAYRLPDGRPIDLLQVKATTERHRD